MVNWENTTLSPAFKEELARLSYEHNLLRGTDKIKTSSTGLWENEEWTASNDVLFYDKTSSNFDSPSDSIEQIVHIGISSLITQTGVPLVDGEYYCLSCLAKTPASGAILTLGAVWSGVSQDDNMRYIDITNEWNRYSLIFKYSRKAENDFTGKITIGSGAGVIYICEPKLECVNGNSGDANIDIDVSKFVTIDTGQIISSKKYFEKGILFPIFNGGAFGGIVPGAEDIGPEGGSFVRFTADGIILESGIGDIRIDSAVNVNVAANGGAIKLYAPKGLSIVSGGGNFGAAGQVLASQGSGLTPKWADLPIAEVEPGNGLNLTSGKLTMGVGSASNFGALKVGSGLTASSGVINHSTAAPYKHIPANGASGNILTWQSSGTAQWSDVGYYFCKSTSSDFTEIANLITTNAAAYKHYTLRVIGQIGGTTWGSGSTGYNKINISIPDDAVVTLDFSGCQLKPANTIQTPGSFLSINVGYNATCRITGLTYINYGSSWNYEVFGLASFKEDSRVIIDNCHVVSPSSIIHSLKTTTTEGNAVIDVHNNYFIMTASYNMIANQSGTSYETTELILMASNNYLVGYNKAKPKVAWTAGRYTCAANVGISISNSIPIGYEAVVLAE